MTFTQQLNNHAIQALEQAGGWLIQQGCHLSDRAWQMRQRRGTAEDQQLIASFLTAWDGAVERIQAELDKDTP